MDPKHSFDLKWGLLTLTVLRSSKSDKQFQSYGFFRIFLVDINQNLGPVKLNLDLNKLILMFSRPQAKQTYLLNILTILRVYTFKVV